MKHLARDRWDWKWFISGLCSKMDWIGFKSDQILCRAFTSLVYICCLTEETNKNKIWQVNWECVFSSCRLSGVPVCSDICDQWFNACKNDQICVENVLVDYNFTVHGENFCPANKSCITYQAMYGNGKNLCEKMWAGSYNYTMPNADYSNCLMMNGSVKPVKPVKPTVESEGVINTAYIALLQLLLFVVAVML